MQTSKFIHLVLFTLRILFTPRDPYAPLWETLHLSLKDLCFIVHYGTWILGVIILHWKKKNKKKKHWDKFSKQL